MAICNIPLSYEYCYIHDIYPGDVMKYGSVRYFTVTGDVLLNYFNGVSSDDGALYRCPIDIMHPFSRDITYRLVYFNQHVDNGQFNSLPLILKQIQRHFVLGVDFSVDKKGKLYALK